MRKSQHEKQNRGSVTYESQTSSHHGHAEGHRRLCRS
nr:MAG TPA: hypothetical protein [Caudoviricetes sp.]